MMKNYCCKFLFFFLLILSCTLRAETIAPIPTDVAAQVLSQTTTSTPENTVAPMFTDIAPTPPPNGIAPVPADTISSPATVVPNNTTTVVPANPTPVVPTPANVVPAKPQSGVISKPAEKPEEMDEFLPYSIAIVSPEDGETFQNDAQTLPVVVKVLPKLRKGDKVIIFVDGEPIGEPIFSEIVELPWLPRGSHTLQAKVIPKNGVAAVSKIITYYQHRTSRLLPRRFL